MAAAEIGTMTLIVKWGGWALGLVTTAFLGVAGFIIKDRNEAIKKNAESSAKLSNQVTELQQASNNRDQMIEELSAEVKQLSQVKDKVLILEVGFKSMKEDLSEMKKDQKDLSQTLREYLTTQLNRGQ